MKNDRFLDVLRNNGMSVHLDRDQINEIKNWFRILMSLSGDNLSMDIVCMKEIDKLSCDEICNKTGLCKEEIDIRVKSFKECITNLILSFIIDEMPEIQIQLNGFMSEEELEDLIIEEKMKKIYNNLKPNTIFYKKHQKNIDVELPLFDNAN